MSKYENYINKKKETDSIIYSLSHFLDNDKKIDKKYFNLKEDYLEYLSWGEYGNSSSYSVKSKELNSQLKRTIELNRTHLIKQTIERLNKELDELKKLAQDEAKSILEEVE